MRPFGVLGLSSAFTADPTNEAGPSMSEARQLLEQIVFGGRAGVAAK
jgi:hypothetical protein